MSIPGVLRCESSIHSDSWGKTIVHRIVSGLVAALALTLVPAQTAHAAAGDPDYNKPTVGDCHDYDLAGLMKPSDTSSPVDCATTHTAKVFKVFMLPDSTSWSDEDAVSRLVTQRCSPAWREWLGWSDLTRALTAYSWAWFQPTKAERDQGARWVRCDVVLYGGNSIAPLP